MYEAQAAQNLHIHQPIPTNTKSSSSSTLDALKRMRTPGRRRAQSYRTLDGLSGGRDAVAWYWRLVGTASSFMILGGFLMLPATFERDTELRVARAVVGIFAVALLTAGFSITALLCFAVRNALFQADYVFLPAVTSCASGLLTVFYNFLVFNRYYWNTPALLVTIAAAVSTIVYGGLFLWTQWKVGSVKTRIQHDPPVPMMQMGGGVGGGGAESSQTALTQEQTYYANYNQNMFPSAYNRGPPSVPPTGYDPDSITEEEMQRQQMLMLLLTREHPSTSPDPTSSTYQIDWQGREDEDAATPTGGWYAPPQSAASSSAYSPTAYPSPGITRTTTQQDLRPWDGVWREVRRPQSQELRDARRREIEGQM